MYEEFFKNKFSSIRGASTPEWRNALIERMVIDFTMYVLSTIEYDDYIIPNYVRKLLTNCDFEYITTPDYGIEYIKVDYKDFSVLLGENYPVKNKERELRQKIMKYSKINYIILSDEEVNDEKEIFIPTDANEVIDVLILDHGYNGGDLYIRDKYCLYLIHKFISYDNDIYSVIAESNRSITEFLSKIESEYNYSFFL